MGQFDHNVTSNFSVLSKDSKKRKGVFHSPATAFLPDIRKTLFFIVPYLEKKGKQKAPFCLPKISTVTC